MNRKAVFIDTNLLNHDGSYYLDLMLASVKRLKVGDIVVAYQDDEEWDAQICFNNNKWGVRLTSEARIISYERKVGHIEGFWEGYHCQNLALIKVLEQAGLTQEKTDYIISKMHIDIHI